MKVKLWWVGARERKTRAFFVLFILSEGNFFKICILPQYIVYWIHFQNIHTSAYQKTLLHTLLLLVFIIVEYLPCILKCVFLYSNPEICLIFAYILMILSLYMLSNIILTKKSILLLQRAFRWKININTKTRILKIMVEHIWKVLG